jgi:hypothetical protein
MCFSVALFYNYFKYVENELSCVGKAIARKIKSSQKKSFSNRDKPKQQNSRNHISKQQTSLDMFMNFFLRHIINTRIHTHHTE